jgi:preprotein translocase subunit SecB
MLFKLEAINIHFKRKKRKKESHYFKWRVLKKQVFRIKNYRYRGMEILSETEGLNLLF